MEDIVLVTGAHRTRSWINAAFVESQTNARVSFEAQVAADASIHWQVSPGHIVGAVLNHGSVGTACYLRCRRISDFNFDPLRTYLKISASSYEGSVSLVDSRYYHES